MPQRCTVCSHQHRERIERARARGRSLRWLARKYGLTKDAIHRRIRHSGWRIPPFIMPTWMTGRVRGNPEKTKPYRWRPGQSGNLPGRPLTPPWTVEELIREAIAGDLRAVRKLGKLGF
jgi:hypothetical protein